MTASGRALLIVVVVGAGLATFVATRFVPNEPVAEPQQRPVAEPPSRPVAEPQQRLVAEPPSRHVAEPQQRPVAEPQQRPVAEAPRPAPPAAAPAPSLAPGRATPPATPEPPRFDVVRVGARGGVVVAGRAAAGAEVILLEDGQEIGRARADARGEWVILPTDPLRPGTRQFALRAVIGGVEMAGPDMVVVVVPEAPLVADAPRPELEAARRQAAAEAEARRVAEAEAQRAQALLEAAAREVAQRRAEAAAAQAARA
ncbi:hypothetical protein HEQ75_24980, partial [Roseomonas sp. BU-1]|nr:hypothetical protein [Falsiroseomonas selenitidurans]